ncbi:MAG: glycosyl hydrolase family 28 protein [Phycisphaerae bacterium]
MIEWKRIYPNIVFFASLFFLIAGCSHRTADPALSRGAGVTKTSNGIYNIRDFGASGNGTIKDTVAIQAAIDKCHQDGGGTVLVPSGKFLTAPLVMKSNVNLHISAGGTLLGSTDISDYKNWQSDKINTQFAPYNCKYLIIAEGAKNISLTGQGKIDGQGLVYYNQTTANTWFALDIKERPGRMIMFALCENVLVEGLTFVDSPAWTFWVIGCDRVKFDKINIINPFQAIHTDGIDIHCCSNVSISNSYFHTGDDCIILRAVDRVLKERKPCENVTVSNCTLESNCNAIRLSYIGDGTIRNCVFNNLTITKSFRGIILQIPTVEWLPKHDQERLRDSGAMNKANLPVIENILFSNIIIEAFQPIWIYLQDGAAAKSISNIHFSDMELRGSAASVFKGSKKAPLQNITLTNIGVRIDADSKLHTDEHALAFYCADAEDIAFRNVRISSEGVVKANEPTIRSARVKNLQINNLNNRTKNTDITKE